MTEPPPFPLSLDLRPVSRRPTTLSAETVRMVVAADLSALRTPPRTEVAATQTATVAIVTYNELVFTRLCLETLLANTEYPSYDVIVVDNASDDGTPDYVTEVAARFPHVSLLVNDRNLGFAPAVNRALRAAGGDVLVLLNNDTVIPPGWLTRLVDHLRDRAVGLVGATTNRMVTAAEIECDYTTYGEFLDFAAERAAEHRFRVFEIDMAAMFCLALRRDVFERLGPLDESFEVGLLEDDDYSHRARLAGYRVRCAEDVFVHHFGEGSFGRLFEDGEYSRLLETNRRRFEHKWKREWQPYARRRGPAYEARVDCLRTAARDRTPRDAVVLVVSRGDEELVAVPERQAWHFPQADDGAYAGHHPGTSAEAIAHLERLRERGASHLLFPYTAFWWLEYYSGLRSHLAERYREIFRDDSCLLYSLQDAPLEGDRPREHAGSSA